MHPYNYYGMAVGFSLQTISKISSPKEANKFIALDAWFCCELVKKVEFPCIQLDVNNWRFW
jgi:hypothetical protein